MFIQINTEDDTITIQGADLDMISSIIALVRGTDVTVRRREARAARRTRQAVVETEEVEASTDDDTPSDADQKAKERERAKANRQRRKEEKAAERAAAKAAAAAEEVEDVDEDQEDDSLATSGAPDSETDDGDDSEPEQDEPEPTPAPKVAANGRAKRGGSLTVGSIPALKAAEIISNTNGLRAAVFELVKAGVPQKKDDIVNVLKSILELPADQVPPQAKSLRIETLPNRIEGILASAPS